MAAPGWSLSLGYGWTLAFAPPGPEFWLAAAFAGLAFAGFAARSLLSDGARYGAVPYALILAGAALVAACLAMAPLDPALVRAVSDEPFRLVFALDVSESLDRAGGGRAETQAQLAKLVEGLGKRKGGERVVGDFIVFGARSRVVASDQPLDRLARSIARSVETVGADETRIEAGLDAALDRLAGRPGAVILATDGLEVGAGREAVLAAASRLADRGVAVYTLGRESAAADLALFSVDAPRLAEVGARSALRIFAGSDKVLGVGGALSVTVDGGTEQRFFVDNSGRRQLGASAPLTFDAPGLHHMAVGFSGQGQEHRSQEHRRRVFSLATRKPRVLVVGPSQWTAVLDREAVDVETAAPGDGIEPEKFDAMVLNGVHPGQLRPGTAGLIAAAVRTSGLGLLVVNGRHAGRDDEPPVLRAYDDTPVAHLLPLRATRETEKEIRAVRLYVMMDQSGSMMMPAGSGGREKRIDVAYGLLGKIMDRLADEDRLSVMNFDGVVSVSEQAMTARGKSEAKSGAWANPAGSASCPIAALEKMESLAVRRPCSVILITDTEVDCEVRYQGCSTQTFGINYLRRGDACPDVYNRLGRCEFYSGGAVELTEKDGVERNFYVVRGRYQPERMRGYVAFAAPRLELEDSLVTREHPGAEMALMRRAARIDPVLAFMRSGAGVTGVLATGFPEGWEASQEGRAAINAWIGKLLSWPDRDRYDIAAVDQGRRLEVHIGLNADKAGRAPADVTFEARIETSAGEIRPLNLRRHPSLALSFDGGVDLDAKADPGAVLHLKEIEAEGRVREQRIPFRLPASMEAAGGGFGAERLSHGLDDGLLEEIRSQTGGEKASVDSIAFNMAFTGAAVPPVFVLWPWLVAVSACLFVILIALSRFAKR